MTANFAPMASGLHGSASSRRRQCLLLLVLTAYVSPATTATTATTATSPSSPARGLRIALHAQSNSRLDPGRARVSREQPIAGSEITTAGMARALRALPNVAEVVVFAPFAYVEHIDEGLGAWGGHWDIVIIEGYAATVPPFIRHLRWSGLDMDGPPRQTFVAHWVLDTYPSLDSHIKRLDVDAFITNSRLLLPELQALAPSAYFPLATDALGAMQPVPPAARSAGGNGGKYDNERHRIVFLGSNNAKTKPHQHRILLEAAQVGGLAIYGHGWGHRGDELTAADPVPEALRPFIRGILPRDDIAELYSSAGVVLSTTSVKQQRLGMINNRIFDALSCGATLISDWFPELEEEFGSLVFFDRGAPGDTTRLLKWLLDTPEGRHERQRRSILARETVLGLHTWSHRMGGMLDFILDQHHRRQQQQQQQQQALTTNSVGAYPPRPNRPWATVIASPGHRLGTLPAWLQEVIHAANNSEYRFEASIMNIDDLLYPRGADAQSTEQDVIDALRRLDKYDAIIVAARPDSPTDQILRSLWLPFEATAGVGGNWGGWDRRGWRARRVLCPIDDGDEEDNSSSINSEAKLLPAAYFCPAMSNSTSAFATPESCTSQSPEVVNQTLPAAEFYDARFRPHSFRTAEGTIRTQMGGEFGGSAAAGGGGGGGVGGSSNNGDEVSSNAGVEKAATPPKPKSYEELLSFGCQALSCVFTTAQHYPRKVSRVEVTYPMPGSDLVAVLDDDGIFYFDGVQVTLHSIIILTEAIVCIWVNGDDTFEQCISDRNADVVHLSIPPRVLVVPGLSKDSPAAVNATLTAVLRHPITLMVMDKMPAIHVTIAKPAAAHEHSTAMPRTMPMPPNSLAKRRQQQQTNRSEEDDEEGEGNSGSQEADTAGWCISEGAGCFEQGFEEASGRGAISAPSRQRRTRIAWWPAEVSGSAVRRGLLVKDHVPDAAAAAAAAAETPSAPGGRQPVDFRLDPRVSKRWPAIVLGRALVLGAGSSVIVLQQHVDPDSFLRGFMFVQVEWQSLAGGEESSGSRVGDQGFLLSAAVQVTDDPQAPHDPF